MYVYFLYNTYIYHSRSFDHVMYLLYNVGRFKEIKTMFILDMVLKEKRKVKM